jgi:ATP-dependent DNA helicase RecQ
MTDRVASVLRDTFGFETLRPGQRAVIDTLLAGRSALAVFPTGGGKSLCYQLPALLMEGLTLVVSPLIALMKDQIDFLQARGVPAARLDGSLTMEEYRQVWDDLHSGALRILYVAPERFQNERFMARLRGRPIALMAIDEAHCISEWGHNFRPDYLKLAAIARQLEVGRVLALTATATPRVAASIRESFGIAEADHVHTGFHRPNLFLRMTPVVARDRDAHLIARLKHHPPGATIVYVTLQKTAMRVATMLREAGFDATAYHAGMKPEERTAVQDGFMAAPAAIVVATIAFGMGIDKADIRYVYHYNLPKSLENHAQEIGRAGRDGEPAVCELFAARRDAVTLKNFAYGDTPMPDAVRGFVDDVLSRGERFDVSKHALSKAHDIRILVVGTLLTYLELEGVIASTAPFYDTYRFQPQRSSAAILADYDPERAAFLRSVLAQSEKARTWFSIDVTAASERIGTPRQRVVAALQYLAEQGDLVLKVSGIRNGYRVVERPDDPVVLADTLSARFAAAEAREVARVDAILDLVTQSSCVVRTLLDYFGEDLGGPCGHCDRCAGEDIPSMPPHVDHVFSEQEREWRRDLAEADESALSTPRQRARVLCGLPSPAAGRARLRRHPAWGRLAHVPFDEVLAFCEA